MASQLKLGRVVDGGRLGDEPRGDDRATIVSEGQEGEEAVGADDDCAKGELSVVVYCPFSAKAYSLRARTSCSCVPLSWRFLRLAFSISVS